MSEYKYEIVEEYIKKYIKNNNLQIGDLLPTESELAENLNIHQNTVKRGLKKLANKGYIYRKQGKGTYVGNGAKKSFDNNNNIIGIIVEDVLSESPLCRGIVKGVDDFLMNYEYNYILGNSDNSYEKMQEYLEQFFKKNVSGIILIPLQINNQHQKNYDIVNDIIKRNCPVVLVDRYLKGTPLDYVTTDNEKGGYIITSHLIELGHKNIACIFEPFCSTLEERLIGYKVAFAEKGLSYSKRFIYWSEERLDEAGKTGVKHLLKSDIEFSAIMCSNDFVARGAFKELKKNKIKVPEEVSLVGYDNSLIATSLSVPLTSYQQDSYKMGLKAAELLMERINNKRNKTKSIQLEGKIIIRDSTTKKYSNKQI